MPNHRKASQILRQRARHSSGSISRVIFKIVLWCGLLGMVAAAAGLTLLYFYINEDLPKISKLSDYHPPVISTVYSADNQKIGEFYKERRIVIPISAIPQMLKEAFISAEDSRFYSHPGIDVIGIFRAFIKNLEAGGVVQGGSTITQQVIKSFLLTPERSYTRKLKEAILAYRITKAFSKDEILFLYLNQIYLGHGAYGVEAAAETYFGKPVSQLNIAECALLAGLPQAPTKYSPFRYPERAKQRQIYVLNRMAADGYITEAQAADAIKQPLDIKTKRSRNIEEMPFYTEQVRRYVESKYGQDALYTSGMNIYTAVHADLQKAAQKAVDDGLADLDKREGYRGAVKHLKPDEIDNYCNTIQQGLGNTPLKPGEMLNAVVVSLGKDRSALVRVGKYQGIIKPEDMRWARNINPEAARNSDIRHSGGILSPGDVIMVKVKNGASANRLEFSLDQIPKVQGALLCLEAGTGSVVAMVGGRDFKDSQFNRAIQSRRQPGSSFKPIIYAAAIDKGYTPATVVVDAPVAFPTGDGNDVWKPHNYERNYLGHIPLRTALEKSINVVTVKILQDIGVDYAINYAKKLGITSHLEHNLSIALGSSGVSLLELVRAYSVFDNGGDLIQPVFITKIVDQNGKILEESHLQKEHVIDASTAYIITSLLESVIKDGTGRKALALNRPAAGKTGTTNNLNDAWFVGYTPEYITGVWVGFDEEASLGRGETGGVAACPIWVEYMKQALASKPVEVFPVPSGVVFAKVDASTGQPAGPDSQNVRFECFKEGTRPIHTAVNTATPGSPDESQTQMGPDELSKSEF